MNSVFWREYREVFQLLQHDRDCRAIVVSGNGKFFTVGLDIKDPSILGASTDDDGEEKDPARKFWSTRQTVLEMQETFTSMERCPQPVIVACHSAVIGAGMDLMTAADIRLCSKDAWFSIKEVDIGLAADVGTLQRLHHVMGNNSLARELCYTARRMESAEAKEAGFVSSVHEDKEATLKHALDMARVISSKSPIAIVGSKVNLNFSRENKIRDSLEYVANWNAGMIQTDDIAKAAMASISKSAQPDFSKL